MSGFCMDGRFEQDESIRPTSRPAPDQGRRRGWGVRAAIDLQRRAMLACILHRFRCPRHQVLNRGL